MCFAKLAYKLDFLSKITCIYAFLNYNSWRQKYEYLINFKGMKIFSFEIVI